MEIIPAIIPKSLKDLQEKMAKVNGLAPLVQIDILDGKLTPKSSWPYLNATEDPDFVAIKKEETEFPFWDSLGFEIDLMVKNPENIWFDWIIAGAKRIVFHYESTENISNFLKNVKTKLVPKESALYVEVGLALNIATSNKDIYPLLEDVDFVQFMGIDKIGFQGQSFDQKVIEKIKDLRGHDHGVIISVDGGVNLDTAPALLEAGADRLVSGSAIFESEDIKEAILEFQNISN